MSEVNVSSLVNLVTINPKLSEFSERFSRLVNHQFEFAGISFWPRRSIPPAIISAFSLERKVNTDRDEHKYFSRAPLHTDDHLKLLNEIEQTFKT